jgi:hypothetical protein
LHAPILLAEGLAACDARLAAIDQTGAMGFDSTRKRRHRSSDIWFVLAAVAVALAGVVWALAA